MSISNYRIKSDSLYLKDIFCKSYEFIIPSYQRPYSWQQEHAEQLFDDLYDTYRQNKEQTYFLGSLVIVKDESSPKSQVIDGQQRLTSLTILLAVIAHNLSGKNKEYVQKYLEEEGNPIEGIEPKPRLVLRKKDEAFFQKYIQGDKLNELIGGNIRTETDAQKNILKNATALDAKIKSIFSNQDNSGNNCTNDGKLSDFLIYIINRCCIVIVTSENENSAFNIFSILNNRGLDLSISDILKADLLGRISNEQNRDKRTEEWEELESRLGRKKFSDLFSHIRMIESKKKSPTSTLEELQEIFKTVDDIETFLEDKIFDYAKAFDDIVNNSGSSLGDNAHLYWLGKVDFSEWVPVAILFLHKKPNKNTEAEFFKKLERLTACVHLSAMSVNKRIVRYAKVLTELEQIDDINQTLPESLELTADEKLVLKDTLDGDIYNLISARRSYLLLRLNSIASHGNAIYDSNKKLTVEHVLPQKIENTEWQKDFDEASHKIWVHRLANLVPLEGRINSSARNLGFADKKNKYFGGRKASSYVLTSQVLKKDSWTVETLEERQKELLGLLDEHWQLK